MPPRRYHKRTRRGASRACYRLSLRVRLQPDAPRLPRRCYPPRGRRLPRRLVRLRREGWSASAVPASGGLEACGVSDPSHPHMPVRARRLPRQHPPLSPPDAGRGPGGEGTLPLTTDVIVAATFLVEAQPAYRILQTGFLFSAKAAAPSFASSDPQTEFMRDDPRRRA